MKKYSVRTPAMRPTWRQEQGHHQDRLSGKIRFLYFVNPHSPLPLPLGQSHFSREGGGGGWRAHMRFYIQGRTVGIFGIRVFRIPKRFLDTIIVSCVSIQCRPYGFPGPWTFVFASPPPSPEAKRFPMKEGFRGPHKREARWDRTVLPALGPWHCTEQFSRKLRPIKDLRFKMIALGILIVFEMAYICEQTFSYMNFNRF